MVEPATKDPEYNRKSVSSATWRPDKGVAEVFEQKGKLLMRMGFIQGGKLHLHIEEIMYLTERGQLLMYSCVEGSKQLLTLQQVFTLMITEGVTKDEYLVYSNLMEASLIVRRYRLDLFDASWLLSRHPARWHVEPSEHPSRVWGRGVRAAPCPQDTHAAGGPEDGEQEQLLREPRQAFLRSCLPHQPSTEGPHNPAGCQQVCNGEQSYSRGAKRRKPDEGAPAGQRMWWPRMMAAEEFGSPEANPRVTVVEEAEEGSCTSDPPHMRPFCSISSDNGAAGAAADIAFAVHKPNSCFSRKKPDPPVVSVCMADPATPPSRAEMAAAEAAGTEGAATCYAYVSHTNVALYAFERVELPDLLAAGQQQC